jgi:hypothetical protein
MWGVNEAKQLCTGDLLLVRESPEIGSPPFVMWG